MKKWYYANQLDLSIIEVTPAHESDITEFAKPEIFDTYKGALERIIEMHNEAMGAELYKIEELVLQKRAYGMKLAKILLDEDKEGK